MIKKKIFFFFCSGFVFNKFKKTFKNVLHQLYFQQQSFKLTESISCCCSFWRCQIIELTGERFTKGTKQSMTVNKMLKRNTSLCIYTYLCVCTYTSIVYPYDLIDDFFWPFVIYFGEQLLYIDIYAFLLNLTTVVCWTLSVNSL